jgi:hypothetical protein
MTAWVGQGWSEEKVLTKFLERSNTSDILMTSIMERQEEVLAALPFSEISAVRFIKRLGCSLMRSSASVAV